MLPSNVVQLRVTINRNGHPKVVLKSVRSILEIPDEENETLSAISFYSNGHWHTVKPTEFDRITIERSHYTGAANALR